MGKIKNGMYGYTLPPIDFFDGCIDFDDYLKSILNDGCDEIFDGSLEKYKKIEFVIDQLVSGMASFKYWEGDLRENIKVFTIPCENQTEIGFICKQSNNGSTFVLSPIELLHLDGDSYE